MQNSNIINRYDDLLYESRPSSLHEFLSNKYNIVHNELFNDALDKYVHSLVDRYITKELLYEYFTLLKKISTLNNSEIIFDNIYNDIFSNKENTQLINYMLDTLSIDRTAFFKSFYDITAEQLNNVKYKLVNFYKDENKNIQSAIEGITQISDIKDFRFVYISLLGTENNNDKQHIYTLEYNKDEDSFILNEELEYKDNEEYFDEYVILINDDDNVKINYTKNGIFELVLNENNYIKNPININDLKTIVEHYINYESKNMIKMFKNTLCNLYKKYHKIIEIKNSEYWMPSSIRIINKIAPYKKFNVDLTKYWNNSQDNSNSKISDLKITKENILDSELIEINYVNGIAKLRSRTNDIIYEVPFKYLDENTNVSDEMTLSNTFMYKYNEL